MKFKTHTDEIPRHVVCAANRYGDLVICGARHYDPVMMRVVKEFGGLEKIHEGLDDDDVEQGFIDQFSVFMSRQEADYIAETNKQIVAEPENVGLGLLISENLY
jgi:hypothetical protein